MAHPVVHFEIGCKDSKKTQEFYKSRFGWNITEAGPAAMIDTSGGPTGHINALDHEPHHHTIFYVQGRAGVSRPGTKASRKNSCCSGADSPGTFAWLQDPEGNTVGLWKPANK